MTIEKEKCGKCKREFPEEFLNRMFIHGEWSEPICPLCALKIRNEYHGLPENTPFTGTEANRLWKKAKMIYG